MTNQEIFNRLNAGSNEDMVELDADYDITAEGKLVPSGDPSGVAVFGGAGRKVPRSLAKELGLLPGEKPEAVEKAPEKPADESEPKEKAVKASEVENKAVKPAEAKTK